MITMNKYLKSVDTKAKFCAQIYPANHDLSGSLSGAPHILKCFAVPGPNSTHPSAELDLSYRMVQGGNNYE